jgi:periplasmic divalent cation tolerance protein
MEMESQPCRIVLTTASSRAEAGRIAHALVEARLAACVNLVENIRSVYRWQGQVEQAEEVLLLIKTGEPLLPALQQKIHELHSYELPEFLVLPVAGGSAPYLHWLREALLPE